MEKVKKLFADYGSIAVGTYLAIFAVVLAGFAVAIASGFHVHSAAGSAGVLGAAWVATKVTQPIRIVATAALTPFVARLWWRFRPRSPR